MNHILLSIVFSSIIIAARAQTATDDFAGEGIKFKASEDGMTRVVITEDNGGFTVHAWSACTPSDCNLGTALSGINSPLGDAMGMKTGEPTSPGASFALPRRASRQTFSQAELARACASTRSGGMAVART